MLYLEDYLENRVDSLEERQKNFFSNCAKNKSKASEKEDYDSIRKEYQKVIEDASEKVQLAEDSYSLVDKYMRKLDQELLKFKLELEADNRGITEILEKHSLEMDTPGLGTGGNNLKENRHPKRHGRKIVHGQQSMHLGGSTLAASTIAAASGGVHHGSGIKLDRKLSLSGTHSMLGRDLAATAASYLTQDTFSFDQLQPHIQAASSVTGNISGGSSMGLNSGNTIGTGSLHQQTQSGNAIGNVSGAGSYPLQHIGAGGSAIAAAASQAIAATQQLTGRRTEYTWISNGPSDLELHVQESKIKQERVETEERNKKSKSASSSNAQIGSTQNMQLDVGGLMDIDTGILDPSSFVMGGNNSPTTEELLSGGNRSGTGSGGTPEQEWYDPSEPRYCICNQVSYGDMVACDNEDCPYEWFHYPCVGIEAPPKGKWFCPTCTANMARRKGRK